MSLLLTLDFTSSSSVSIVNNEHVIVAGEELVMKKRVLDAFMLT